MQINAEAAARPEATNEWQISQHEVRQDEGPHPLQQESHARSFDSVNFKYVKFDNVTSIIFTKLESSISQSQKRVHIKYEILEVMVTIQNL